MFPVFNPTEPAWPTFKDIPSDVVQAFWEGLPKHALPKKYKALKKLWINHFGRHCLCCGISMQDYNHNARNYATIDHVLARSLGGKVHDHANLTVICSACNTHKSGFESKIKMALAPREKYN
jgi:5-methylcytosine-specific restriction endonuclease McrA